MQERQSNEVDRQREADLNSLRSAYDYVVVGAGSAGCALV
jgi:hypothetical protein